MNAKNIELLLAGRKVIDSYMAQTSTLDDSDSVQSAQHTEATNKLMASLTALGFSVFQAFIDFNRMMCLQAVEECRIKAEDWKEFPFDIAWGEQWRF